MEYEESRTPNSNFISNLGYISRKELSKLKAKHFRFQIITKQYDLVEEIYSNLKCFLNCLKNVLSSFFNLRNFNMLCR